MGPSTNLSARLMSKARAGEIICDASTRRRDRSHRYVIVGKVKAKGYEQMVTTYSPLLKDVLPGKSIHRLSSELSAKSLSPSSGKVHSFHDLDIEAFEEKVYSRQPSDRKGVPTEDVLIITAMKHRLHGRQEVVQSMLDFLMPFSDEAVTNAADLKAYLNYSEDGDFLCPPTPVKQDRKTFNCSLSATALVLSGKQGIGKTCILRAISEKLEALVQIDPSYNIHIFRGNAQILHKSVPLSVWRPLLSEIFTQFATFDTENGKAGSPMKCFTKPSLITSPSRSHVSRPTLRKDISGNGGKSLRKLSAVDIKTVKSKISVGIDVLTGYLAPEIRVLLPLLCSCFPHAPAVSDNEYTAKLHGVARLQSMLTLIQGIIDVYVKITDCVAFIVL